ncbi:transcriptional regulator [Rhizobium sp. Root149]|uniref:CopG family ribbon-helix-helix protein n=2 Tax=Rhizobium TaxID=379 RepID=A0ABV8E4N5_9HYPH|nr:MULTISPECIES: ribbon-helix-helix protein, CopG family [Rhizobium]KQZ49919.1 transcriptional regulator [Rhizobium sp. Root149]MBB4144020.1 putative transcriptional regulator [Rhizobium rhizoryzae]MCJ8507249.1 ribbon-helix-helix protein, CopG family [Rhizobium lemnae]
MKSSIELSDDISRRIDLLAERSRLTRSQIIEDALANGRSLAWQERWIAGVQSGLDEADSGEFASEDEISRVLTKYDPV